jgi:hypothetical protein
MIKGVRVKLRPVLLRKKEAFSNRKNLLTSKWDLNSRKKLVKYYIWNIALYGAAAWTLRKVGQIFLEIFEKWSWRRMEIIWTDRVRKEEIDKFIEERNILHAININNSNCIGHTLQRNCLLKQAIERKTERKLGVEERGRNRRKHLLNYLKERRGYWKLKRQH